MKDKTQVMDQRIQNKSSDWLYQEYQEEDFLSGKTPQAMGDICEDEE